MNQSEKNIEDKNIEDKNINAKILDIKHQQKDSDKPQFIPISRKMRWIVFSFIVSLTVFMDLDQGILSSTTTELMRDFHMSERELGGLGGMIFLGSSIGCLCSFALISRVNRKYLLLATMSLDVLCLFFTTQTTNLILLYMCRIVAGIVQCFLAIYSPVWTDQFGVHKHKSILISLINLSSTIGSLFGYVMGIVFGWENSFYIQNIIIIIHIVFLILFLPDKYFSMNLMPLKAKLQFTNLNDNKETKENAEEDENDIIINKIEDTDMIINESDNENENENALLDNKKDELIIKDEDTESLFEDMKIINEDVSRESFLTYLKVLIKSPIYLLMNTTLTCIYLIVSSIQFWINDYLENGLLIKDKKIRLYSFAGVIITSPAAGIILGGIIAGKIGGYDTERAIYIPIIASFFVSILANIVPLSTKLYIFIPLFWAYLFLGSVLLPVARGIVLVSIDKKYGGQANAVSTLIYNIVGRLPGPNLYAFYKSKCDKSSRIPFWLLLNMAVPGFLASLICLKFQKEKYRKLRERGNDEEEEKEEKEEKKEKEEKGENVKKEEKDEKEEKREKEDKEENEEKGENEKKEEKGENEKNEENEENKGKEIYLKKGNNNEDESDKENVIKENNTNDLI